MDAAPWRHRPERERRKSENAGSAHRPGVDQVSMVQVSWPSAISQARARSSKVEITRYQMLDSSLSWSPGDLNEKNLDLVLLSTSCTRAQPGAGCGVGAGIPSRPPGQTVRRGSTCAGYPGYRDSRRGSEHCAPRGWRISSPPACQPKEKTKKSRSAEK